MPPKLELDENTKFLFTILASADECKIDWHKANVKLAMSRPDVV